MTQFIILAVLMLFSAFFSAAETTFTSLGKIKMLAMKEEGRKGAKDVEKIMNEPEKMLSAVLIGNNAANVATSTLSASIAIRFAGDGGWMLGLTTVIVTFALLVLCEVTPKTLAVRKAAVLSRLFAKPMLFFEMVFTPVSVIINGIIRAVFFILRVNPSEKTPSVTETELKAMVDVSHKEGILQKNERVMIDNLFDFDDMRAKDIMSPRTDMAALPRTASFRDVMRLFNAERFSRLPVYAGDIDHIVGILHLKDVAFLDSKKRGAFKIEHYMRKPFFSYETKRLSSLLAEMRTESISFAVIIDEYGGTSGIVTLEDLIEEIVGEIYDEYDEEEQNAVERVSENEFTIDGGMKLDDFNDLADACLTSEDYESVGGFVVGLLGEIPEVNARAEFGDLRFTVLSAAKNRIEKLRVCKIV